jgi:hypothetical protein
MPNVVKQAWRHGHMECNNKTIISRGYLAREKELKKHFQEVASHASDRHCDWEVD